MRRFPAVTLLASFSLSAAAFDCPPPTPGLPDIKAFGYYSDAAGSVRDEAKFKETHALTKPFEDFATQVSKLSDRYLEKGEPAAAACTIAWLERWAQDGAMLGTMVRVNNDQSEYVRKWTNASAAIAWNKVRDKADADQRNHIDTWLKAVSKATLAFWDNPKHKRNNHYYWTGVGVMATAVATGDAGLLAEARNIYDSGLSEIRDDGSLPMEMARGIRALHYHNFSAMPLVMIAEMARKTGQDWFALRDARLDKLMSRVASGLRDPAWFEQAAGAAPQIIPPARDRGWIVLYRAHAPQGERFEGLFGQNDSAYVRDLGGDLRLMLDKGVFTPR
ncbi:MAG: putative alginate lyase [Proteobacteria bacterium]|nr:putative alginate lyase [Pseudomonadota bacterium]